MEKTEPCRKLPPGLVCRNCGGYIFLHAANAIGRCPKCNMPLKEGDFCEFGSHI